MKGREQEAIDLAARAMCTADGQRHRRLEHRDGTPCRLHLDAAYVAVEALLPMLAAASEQASR